jgi:enoyl-CoA hydratase/carnithine racemase
VDYTALLDDAAGQLLVSVDAGVGTVEFHQPARRNAISYAMWTALARLMPALADDEDVSAIVLRGTQGGPFSAGADISEFQALRATPESAARYAEAVEAGEGAVISCPKPTVALVQGFAIGGGTQLAAACDLRVSDTSARFGVTPAKLGIVYPLPSTARLVDVVGASWASWLLLTGELVDAATALRIGLVHEVTDDVEARVLEVARTLTTRARISHIGAKALIARSAAGHRAHDATIQALYDASLAGPEYAEGVAAFLAKRDPEFRRVRG